MKKILKSKTYRKRGLATIMALLVAFTYSAPITSFAGTAVNTAEIVKAGDTLYYDKDGKPTTSDGGKVAVEMSKTIKKLSGEDEFEITLAVKGTKEVFTSTKETDAAVVLVMDVSNSMVMDDKAPNTPNAKLENAKKAANAFLENYVKDAGNAKRLVSVVEFGWNGKTVSTWIEANDKNGSVSNAAKTAISNVKNQFLVSSETVSKSFIKIVSLPKVGLEYAYCDYSSCEHGGMDNRIWKSDKDAYDNLVNNHKHEVSNDITDRGGTNIEAGLALARNLIGTEQPDIYALDDIGSTSVVMLTDGIPSAYVEGASSKTETSFIEGVGTLKPEGAEYYKDIPSLCSDIKKLGTSVYTVAYDTSGNDTSEVNGKSVADWLEKDVKVTANYSAASGLEDLYKAFSKINGDIEDSITTEVVKIEDPMGDLITFDPSNELNKKIKFDNGKLTVGISQSDALDANGEPIVYTYKYKIKLDTSAENFIEGKEYATNGRTTLNFRYGKDTEEKIVDFSIPSVKGKTPEVDYTVEYYKWDKTDKEAKGYPTEPTETFDGGKVKLWSTVNAPDGYNDKYSSENYHFVAGDSSLQMTASKTGNVLKLYYKPDLADVTVKHYYKTDVINADGSTTNAEDYTLNNTVPAPNQYVGEQFNATLIDALNGVKYELNKDKSDRTQITVTNGTNTINLYYDGVRDDRAKTSILVNRIYETGSWQLNDKGRYEEVFTAGDPQEYEKSSDVRVGSTYETSTTDKVTEDYVYHATDKGTYNPDTHKVSLALSSDANVMNLTFRKPAPESERQATEVKVVHQYYLDKKEIKDGQLVTTIAKEPTAIVEDDLEDYFVGETFRPVEANSYGGIMYVSDSGNADKIQDYKLQAGKTEITLSYRYMQTPAPTSVTVNHIYRTHDKVEVDITRAAIDAETGEPLLDENDEPIVETVGTKVVDIVTIDGEDSQTYDSIEIPGDKENSKEALYAGFEYVAKQDGNYNGKNYTFNNEESTKDGTRILSAAANDNVINLYYDIKQDTREAVVEVHHIYVENFTTVENGKVVKKTVHRGVGAIDKYGGKDAARTEVSIVARLERIDGEVYELRKLPPDKKNDFDGDYLGDYPRAYTLEPGTNKTIEIVYIREHSDLKATVLTVTHKYINKIMTVVNGIAGYYDITAVESTGFTVDGKNEIPENVYVGEKYTIDLAPIHNGVTYTASTNNPGTDITLGDGENHRVFEYSKETPLPTTTVTVNHHYSHTKIDSIGNSETTEEDRDGTSMPNVYVGTDVKTEAATAGYDFKEFKVSGTDTSKQDKDNNVTVTVSNAAVAVDYYYTKTTDNSVASTWKINHHYRTLDWNDDAATKEYVLDENVSTSGKSYATKPLTGVPVLKADADGNATFKLDKATSENDFTEGYTIKLVAGENIIDFYYTQEIDSKVDTAVKVIHNYYKHDTSGLIPDAAVGGETSESAIKALPGVLAGTYEETFTGKTENAWVENKFIAKKKTTFGEGDNQLTYVFKDATPSDLTIKSLALDSSKNVIEINYLYEYDATENVSMKVNHTYRTFDRTTNTITESIDPVIAKFGNADFGSWNKEAKTFTAKEIGKSEFARQTTGDNMTVKYTAGDNEMTVLYTRTIGGGGSTGGGGGGNTGGGGGGNTPPPNVNIPDEQVPLGDLPGDAANTDVIIEDEAVPMANADDVVIFDEAVPLSGLPQTGGAGIMGFLTLGGALMALGAMLRKREDKSA